MSTATQDAPRAVHRADYRVPDFLVDTVDLTFALDPAATLVTSRLAMRRNPASTERAAPLRLDGEALTLVSARLDGQALDASRYALEPGALVDRRTCPTASCWRSRRGSRRRRTPS